MAKLGRRAADLLTAALFLLAGYLLVQPGSPLNNWWRATQLDRRMRGIVERQWDTVSGIAQPLSASAQAPRVIEVIDYECPFCRAGAAAVDSARKNGTAVAVVHLPLPIHPRARGAALAAICAASAGRFSQMHEALMKTDIWLSDTNWVGLAASAAITDTSAFRRCVTSQRAAERLTQSIASVDSFRFLGTPTFISRSGVRTGVLAATDVAKLGR